MLSCKIEQSSARHAGATDHQPMAAGLFGVHLEVCGLRQLRQSGLWAVNEVVVGAGVAGIGGGGVVLGVGVCIRAGRLEGLSAGRGIVAWAVCVGAVGATVGVG